MDYGDQAREKPTAFWKMTEVQTGQEYEIQLTFQHDDIPEGTTVSVNLAGYIYDKDSNSQQVTIDLSGEVTQDSSGSDSNVSTIEESAKSANQVALIASIASGSVTGNFSGLWNVINTLMILAFIPLMPNSLPEDVVNVMKSFLDFQLIPNFFQDALENFVERGPEPYSYAKEFGYLERMTNVLAIYSESAVLAVFILSYSFWYTTHDQNYSMQWVTILIIFTIMIFNWMNMLRQQLSTFRDMCQKWRQGRKQRNAENNDAGKANTTENTMIQESESELPYYDNSKRMVFPDSE